ncbi:hypothetical protein [Pleionea sp. CnH1-48]|uniref:hypothetical protein n=1 Tax=Pleionea sp. CnH1-48 TaxID=2954494 RepID=UPI0020972258|nr:hypothetical protein [Pleionea sp. CnH1-48]MCO7227184.1 hypothetical protein [Pleionea sp. CnH1-48]
MFDTPSLERALQMGTGKAIRILKKNSHHNLDHLILEACLSNQAYDPQSEPDRSQYLKTVIQLAQDSDAIEEAVIDALSQAQEDDWDTHQLVTLVTCFAQNGNKRAKDALYQRYTKPLTDPSFSFLETDALVILDGLKGLEICANTLGQLLEQDTDFWVDDSLISVFETSPTKEDTLQYLERHAQSDRFIKRYLTNVKEHLEKQQKPRALINWSYEMISQHLSQGKSLSLSIGKSLSFDVLQKLANDFKSETDEKSQLAYLKIFFKAPYPGAPSDMIPLLEHNNERMVHFAIRALAQLEHPQIKKYLEEASLHTLKNKVPLFIQNGVENAPKTFEAIIPFLDDEDETHRFISDVVKVLKRKAYTDSKVLLIQLYELSHCSVCRFDLLKLLHELTGLPKTVVDEAIYDCHPDSVALASTYLSENH